MYTLCIKTLCVDYGVDSNNYLLLVRHGDDSEPVHGDDDYGYRAHEVSHTWNGIHKSESMKCYSSLSYQWQWVVTVLGLKLQDLMSVRFRFT